MAKSKSQKHSDLKELTEKLAGAKGIVFSDYRGTTVKDMDKFRRSLRKENIFSKVYKLTLVKKALEANGLDASSINYKTPVILTVSTDDEVAPARVIKTFNKDVKTVNMLEGFVAGKLMGKAQIEALGSLPGKNELRAQFLSVLNGTLAGFVRVLGGRAKKLVPTS